MSTFTNSEDPDKMQHNAAFHQGLHYLQWLNKPTEQKCTIVQNIFNTIQNGLYPTNYIYIYQYVRENPSE